MSAPILIFDSGVGGLSVFDAIHARLPQHDYVYACDNAAFPYGPKPEAELIERVHAVLDALLARYQPQLLVIACNTASTVALPRLRHHYQLPIVGVVPAIKPAALISENKIIGLLATPGTVQRSYTQDLITEFAADCEVLKVGSSELVQMAEDELRGLAHSTQRYRDILAPFFADPAHSPDSIVLGCTHFPVIRAQLAKAAPQVKHWIDSGEAIARRVIQLLAQTEQPLEANADGADVLPKSSVARSTLRAAFTADDADIRALWPALQQRGFSECATVTVAAL